MEKMLSRNAQKGGTGYQLLYNAFILLPCSLTTLHLQSSHQLSASDRFRKRLIKYCQSSSVCGVALA